MTATINHEPKALPTLCLVVISLATAALCSAPVDAREHHIEGKTSVAPLFADHAPLPVTIEAPLTTLMRDRPDEEYLDGTFSFTGEDGEVRTVDLKVRTRGKYRRQVEHCDFAPLRLNFRREQVADTEFGGQDKLKLVTHCKSDRPYYEQLVLREFLAYRFLRAMTDKSFAVRLFQIDYVDTEGAKSMTKVGFVIEDDDDVAERNGMVAVKTGNISSGDLDRGQQNLINVFQYLIGNTEYSLTVGEPDADCCHNADLMSATGGPPFTPLAYDFDFAGIVNAPYAEPNPRFKLRTVRHRLYRGSCENNELLPATVQRFLDKRDVIYGIVDELELLSSRSRRDVTRYLNSFYDHIAQTKSMHARFLDRCEDSSP